MVCSIGMRLHHVTKTAVRAAGKFHYSFLAVLCASMMARNTAWKQGTSLSRKPKTKSVYHIDLTALGITTDTGVPYVQTVRAEQDSVPKIQGPHFLKSSAIMQHFAGFVPFVHFSCVPSIAIYVVQSKTMKRCQRRRAHSLMDVYVLFIYLVSSSSGL